MRLSEEDKSYAILQYKMRMICGFIASIITSIVFIVCIIVLALGGKGDLALLFIVPLVFCILAAVGFGIFLYRRRDKKAYKKEEIENKE